MKRALLVGINEYPRQPLEGCIQDVIDVANYLDRRRDFAAPDVEMLCDSRAKKASILGALEGMLAASRPGDHLLFHYSGHGAQVPSDDAGEADGQDEVLCPADFDWTPETSISDKELTRSLGRLPVGVTLTCVLDSCHSGGMDRVARTGVRPRFLSPPVDIRRKLRGRSKVRRFQVRAPELRGVAMLMACAEGEVAADAQFDGTPNGAFTHHLLQVLELGGSESMPLLRLIESVRAPLADFAMHPRTAGSGDVLTAPLVGGPGLSSGPLRGARGEGVTASASWDGVTLTISHAVLSVLVPATDVAAVILAAIGPMAGVPAPILSALAGYVAQYLGDLQGQDDGSGVFVRFNWFRRAIESGPMSSRSPRLIADDFAAPLPEGGGSVRI